MLKILQNKNRKGFTLIELLVVIAIIGILSSIVLVSVNSARNKAKDTAIKAALGQIRTVAEMNYVTNYDPVCTEAGGGSGNSTLTQTVGTDFARIDANIKNNNGNVAIICNESTGSTGYAVWSPLIGTTGTCIGTAACHCIDSVGQSNTVTTAIAADSTICP